MKEENSDKKEDVKMTEDMKIIEENPIGKDELHLVGELGKKMNQDIYVVGGYVHICSRWLCS